MATTVTLIMSSSSTYFKRSLLKLFSSQNWSFNILQRKRIHGKTAQSDLDFGFLFDIDGVICRGKTVLPSAREAFCKLVDRNGKFRVPVLFVTNAGNTLRQRKAQQLSQLLDIKVHEDQVVMSHSPLRMFKQFHNKHILASGQGPIQEIARALGFTNVTTIDQFRHHFPSLDMVDHKRRKSAPCGFEEYFPRIEAVILFGEPVRWETNLQLIIDCLLTNGKPSAASTEIPYPHIPVLACNMDLLWMAEACIPRFGHGCFLHCLESLYQKISGRELRYTGLVGKPSELTYHHVDYLLDQQAKQMGTVQLKTIYSVGDNPGSDIYGANLYDRYLKKKARSLGKTVKQKALQSSGLSMTEVESLEIDVTMPVAEESNEEVEENYAQSCESILVCTGVYCSSRDYVTYGTKCASNHNHRDFVLDPELTQPKYVVPNVLEAVNLVFDKEKFK
ncbi:hypothetical protein ACJMK2_016195 [Sinanodonta woodiana]|uniref:Haloacid dehalogenase-like hydrolase domain-containing 5 n=1 Tax=Sinanodonta woodiana TaxID=1069815 RepID=A0ABD3USV5_SINWO